MKNDQRNILFLELLVEPTSGKVNLNIGMDDIVDVFEGCVTSGTNTYDINGGAETPVSYTHLTLPTKRIV